MVSTDDSTPQDSAFSAAIASLVESGATFKDVRGTSVHILSNVRYGQDSPLQSLDLYVPDQVVKGDSSSRPVYIHIHGGGWSRGSKENAFYGSPAMAKNAAASGCIAVAPGYRRGVYPEFVHDSAAAIKWVVDNITNLGGDLDNMFLSGHSAGGHIASLLILRQSCFLTPLGLRSNMFRGLILVSGVYDLFSPLRKAPVDAKNKWFVVAYVMPAFGSDENLRKQASPLLLLQPDKDTSVLGKVEMAVAMSLRRSLSGHQRISLRRNSASSLSRGSNEEEETAAPYQDDVDEKTCEIESSTKEETKVSNFDGIDINTNEIPPTLIMNASLDMGLDENGELMAAALKKYTDVKYVRVPSTDHASICWNEETGKEVMEFVEAQCQYSV